MKLQQKIWLAVLALIALIIASDFFISRSMIENNIRAELMRSAHDVRAMLLATHRIYQKQFLDSGLPINDKTIGFLPVHALSRISSDFPNWSKSGLYFNNVSDMPRNPDNLADVHELEAISYFRANPKETERFANITNSNEESFLHFTSPIWIEPYCLKCHGEKNRAPAAIASTYDKAFGYRVDDLRGVMSIKLPLTSLREEEFRAWQRGFNARLAGYLMLLLLIGTLMSRLVLRRISRIDAVATRIGAGDYSVHVATDGKDELDNLGRAIDKMAGTIYAREQSLREAEALQHKERDFIDAILDTANSLILVLDRQGRIVRLNRAGESLVGYHLDEIQGRYFWDIFLLEQERDAVKEVFEHIRAGDVVTRHENHWLRKDGRLILFDWSNAALHDELGEVDYIISVGIDITQRKRTDDDLQKSQHNLAEAQKLVHLGSWELDLVHNRLTWSEEMYRIFGMSPEEFGATYETFLDTLHPDDRDMVDRAYRSSLKEGRYDIEYRIIHKADGQLRWGHAYCEHERDANGKALRSFGTVLDITEQKHAEEVQRASNERLVTIFNSLDAIVYIADMETYELLFINKFVKDVFGDVVGQPCWKALQAGQSEPCSFCTNEKLLDAAGNPTGIYHWEFQNTTNGHWYDVRDRAIPWVNGRVVRMEIATDITARKATESALASEKANLSVLLETASDGIHILDEQGNLKQYSRAFATMLGYSYAEISGFNVADWDAQIPKEKLVDAVRELIRMAARFETKHRRKDGTLIDVEINAKGMEIDGNSYLYASSRDMTERNQTLQDLRAAKEAAEVANITKSRFLANMSHEIRTPMNGILGMAQMLLMPNLKEAERQDYARTVLNSGRTLLTLLNDILDLSKVETGKVELESTAIEPWVIIQETKLLFANAAGRKALRLEANWFGATNQRYLGDPYRLRQMLSNLVGNAIKFTTQGEVRIEAREIERDGETAILEFAIADTGVGIPLDKQERLFQPFSQADNSTTRQYGGTGLGLSIVRNLARVMGGDIGYESAPGVGSRFWFRIRANLVALGDESRQAERLHPKEKSPGFALSQMAGRVLVVEDDSANREVIKALLNMLGLNVAFAENGRVAVEAITRGDSVDIILMDVHMPVMDGIEATERIRQWETENGRPHRPIIALTADAFEKNRQRCLAVGMDDFMAKPIASIDTLAAVLARWLPMAPVTATPAPAGKPVDVPRVVAILRELKPFLVQYRFDAISRFRDLQEAVAGTDVAAEISEVGQVLYELRFDVVLERLSQIASAQAWEDKT